MYRQTSRDAAKRIRPYLRGIDRDVFSYIKSREHGATAEEVIEHFREEISHNSVRPALISLEKKGYIQRTDRVRPTRSGRNAQVWVVVTRANSDSKAA